MDSFVGRTFGASRAKCALSPVSSVYTEAPMRAPSAQEITMSIQRLDPDGMLTPSVFLPGTAIPHPKVLVFDREGYSPAFLKRMKAQHIACLT